MGNNNLGSLHDHLAFAIFQGPEVRAGPLTSRASRSTFEVAMVKVIPHPHI